MRRSRGMDIDNNARGTGCVKSINCLKRANVLPGTSERRFGTHAGLSLGLGSELAIHLGLTCVGGSCSSPVSSCTSNVDRANSPGDTTDSSRVVHRLGHVTP